MTFPSRSTLDKIQKLLAFSVNRSVTYRSAELSEYEKERLKNIERNNEILRSLGLLDSPTPTLTPPPAPRVRRPRIVQEPTRRSERTRKDTQYFEPLEELPKRARTASSSQRASHQRRPCHSLEGFTEFQNCSARSRLRHKLSKINGIEDVDPNIVRETLDSIGGSFPTAGDGSYRFVHYIAKTGHWHFRSSFGRGDFGTFCNAELAAFVSNYARLHPSKTIEQVWVDLGIVNIDDVDACIETASVISGVTESEATEAGPSDASMADMDRPRTRAMSGAGHGEVVVSKN